MIKYIKYYILLGVAILAASCEDKFDAKIYGSLMENEFPTNAKEYESYMMTCYLPFTTAFTYSINEGTGQHGWYIATGGRYSILRLHHRYNGAGIYTLQRRLVVSFKSRL